MKIPIILTLAAVVLAKNHHHHSHSDAIVKDIDNYNNYDINNSDDLFFSQKPWNPETLTLVKSL